LFLFGRINNRFIGVKMRIRRNKDGLYLGSDGKPIFAFLAHNPITKSWTDTHYIGSPETMDGDVVNSRYYQSIPKEEYYEIDIIRSKIESEFKGVHQIKIKSRSPDKFVVAGTFKSEKNDFKFVFKFGDGDATDGSDAFKKDIFEAKPLV
jgi:hypothetical protein